MAWCVSLTLTEYLVLFRKDNLDGLVRNLTLTEYLVLFRKENLDGLVREFDVLTLSTTMWHVLEYDHYKLHEQSYGQFHDGDTYVVRWQYMITASGTPPHTHTIYVLHISAPHEGSIRRPIAL